MSPRNHYSVFGRTLASDFDFDMLRAVAPPPGGPDISVLRTGGLARLDHASDPFFDILPDRQYLHWQAVGTFVVDSPGLVRIAPKEGVSDHLVSQPFLGIVMSIVLERMGMLCLHAGAVSLAGRAAIFLGDKGAGKSTTNGALLARGHTLLTDDLAAISGWDDPGAALRVAPGISTLKLWPDSLSALSLAPDARDRIIHSSADKMQKHLPSQVPDRNAPIGTLFELHRTGAVRSPQVDRLPAHEALQMVLRNSFIARFGQDRLGQAHLVRHMTQCARLVAEVPAWRLTVPEDFGCLGELVDAIEAAHAGQPGPEVGPSSG